MIYHNKTNGYFIVTKIQKIYKLFCVSGLKGEYLMTSLTDQISNLKLPEDEYVHDNLPSSAERLEITELVAEVTEDIIRTPYTPKRILQLQNDYDLDQIELKTVTSIIEQYRVRPDSIEKLLLGGIEVKELESFVALHKNVSDDVVEFERRSLEPLSKQKDKRESFYYFIPNAGECLSYQNLIFLRDVLHRGTAQHVAECIYDLSLILEDNNSRLGIGVLVHRMRNLYNEDPTKYTGLSPESLAHVALGIMPQVLWQREDK